MRPLVDPVLRTTATPPAPDVRGSARDDGASAAAEKAGATMLLTGRRHFRH